MNLADPAPATSYSTHVWLVDPDTRVLEVYRLERGLYVRVLAASETDRVRAEPFEAMELALEDLWRM